MLRQLSPIVCLIDGTGSGPETAECKSRYYFSSIEMVVSTLVVDGTIVKYVFSGSG